MKILNYLALFLVLTGMFIGCSSDDAGKDGPDEELPDQQYYFPANGSSEWETIAPAALGCDSNAMEPLLDLLEAKDTKAFIILKDGKLAMENYFGSFTKDSLWYWASAGKTLTAFSLGIAQEKGFLSIQDPTSTYLGAGWTSASLDKEQLITIRNQLTMTSGLNDLSFDCVSPACLEYLADSGSRWAYHNGPYTLLQAVISAASNSTYSSFFNSNLRDKIGMDGFWFSTNGSNNVYFSTARSMARFGLLNLNNGKWDTEVLLGDTTYLNAMKNTSQDLNKSYGYLWWLNGKESYMAPALQVTFNGPLIANAPSDMYSGLGKNDQKLYIVPSKNLVVVRLGEDSGEGLLGPSSFDNQLWEKISDLIN